MTKTPNILVFMPDQLRPDWFGPGNRGGARTPHLDRLIARGTTFTKAVCPSPICGPSRACLASGHEYDRTAVAYNEKPFPIEMPNMYRQLGAAGYAVLTCGKLDLLKGEPDWGRDGQHVRDGVSRLAALGFTGGLDSGGKHAAFFALRDGDEEPYGAFLKERGLAEIHVRDFEARRNLALGKDALSHPGIGPNYLNTRPTPMPDDAYGDNWVGACGLDILERTGRDRPWFLQVNLPGPHEPMDITAAMAARVAALSPQPPDDLGDTPAETHRAIRRAYTAMVENIDDIFGRYVAYLERTRQIENTLIVFTSDHGEMLGDCGLWEKFVPHQASIGVPLVVAGPGVAQGRAHDGPATILDLHATALDIAGATLIPGTDSRSLRSVLADPSRPHREVAFSGLGQWRAAFDGRCKLVAGYDARAARLVSGMGRFDPDNRASWRIVDIESDPCERGNLGLDSPEGRRLVAALMRNIGA